MMANLCAICGKPESEHHEFNAMPTAPDGCVCDTGTWNIRKPIPPPCGTYVGNGTTYCATCEHDSECHHETTIADSAAKRGEGL